MDRVVAARDCGSTTGTRFWFMMASVALYQLLERNGYRNLDASPAVCRSGSRQGIGWKERWWMLRATDPGPEQPPAHRYAGRDHHPVVGSLGAGEDWSWWVVDQAGVEAIVRRVREVPSVG